MRAPKAKGPDESSENCAAKTETRTRLSLAINPTFSPDGPQTWLFFFLFLSLFRVYRNSFVLINFYRRGRTAAAHNSLHSRALCGANKHINNEAGDARQFNYNVRGGFLPPNRRRARWPRGTVVQVPSVITTKTHAQVLLMNTSFGPRLQIIYILRRRCNLCHNNASRRSGGPDARGSTVLTE